MPSGNAPLTSYLSQGTLSNYEPSWRDRAAYWLAQNWYGDNREGVQKANRLMNVADVTPVGIPLALDDAARSFGRGNYAGGAVTLAMAGIPAVRKEAKLTGEAAKKTLDAILEKHGLTQPKTIKAYHGSPHSFDKFDMSKIGTGEGAQAYGHGLYFAENEGVARNYRDQLSRATGNTQTPQGAADRAMGVANGDRNQAIAALEREVASMQAAAKGLPADHPFSKRIGNEYLPAIDLLKGGYKPGGSMYEVQINADPEQFLDWDKPLSEQPEHVRKSLESLGIAAKNNGEWTVKQTPSGKWTLYNVWGEKHGTFASKEKAEAIARENTRRHNEGGAGLAYTQLGGNQIYSSLDKGDASRKLKEAGIPGIKYLDAGSRTKGDGSRNYVVFDERLITILRKYGLLPPIASAAAYGATQDQQTAY